MNRTTVYPHTKKKPVHLILSVLIGQQEEGRRFFIAETRQYFRNSRDIVKLSLQACSHCLAR